MENPWNIQSIYDLQYFNCPSCVYKNHSKQELIDHAYDFHPESIEYLMHVNDKSLIDVILPWNVSEKEIKSEENDLDYDLNLIKVEGNDNYPLSVEVEEIKTENFQNDSVDETLKPLIDKTIHRNISKMKKKCKICNEEFDNSRQLGIHIQKAHESCFCAHTGP